jgi:large subunit ribosomal protein L15
LELHELKPVPGSRSPLKTRGRGSASGTGGTSGRGHKGQRARSGGRVRLGFEGGQMPLIRRLPKVGFTSHRKKPDVVNLSRFEVFSEGEEVTPEALIKKGIIRKTRFGIKVLGKGEITKKLVVFAHAFSGPARQAIERAGGSCVILPLTLAAKKP